MDRKKIGVVSAIGISVGLVVSGCSGGTDEQSSDAQVQSPTPTADRREALVDELLTIEEFPYAG